MALMTGIAAQVHQLLGQRRNKVPPMEAVLFTAVRAGALVPGETVRGPGPGRRSNARLVFQHLLVAGKALLVGCRIDSRLEMQGVVACPEQPSAKVGGMFAVRGLADVPAGADTPCRKRKHEGDKYPLE